MATTTVTASTSGRFIRANGTWPQDRDGLGATLIGLTQTNPDYLSGAREDNMASDWCYRSFLFFDLSALAGAVINTATLRLYVYSKDGSRDIVVTLGYQSDPVVAADFDTSGYTQRDETTNRGSLVIITGITTDQYNSLAQGNMQEEPRTFRLRCGRGPSTTSPLRISSRCYAHLTGDTRC
ncbi:hypothetical protein LCGC14_2985130, partial [marine sediment metagenome]